MSTILVTGGTGFIGSYVVDRLARDGHNVTVLSRNHASQPDPRPRVTNFWGDIRDETSVFEAMAHVDGFIHLAGVLGTQETIQNPRPAVDTNILGGLNVLEAAARYDVPGVNIAVGNFWENNPYSITKNSVERFADMYNKYRGTRIAVVRAMNAYGPRQSVAAPYGTSKVRKIMPSFIHKALNGDPIEVYGDGTQIMDMVYVTDVADILVDALYLAQESIPYTEPLPGFDDRHITSYPVFEAGTGVRTSVIEIAREVLNATRDHTLVVPGQKRIVNLPMRPGETGTTPVLADTNTLRSLYGDYPRGFVSLKEGVRKTVEFYRGD